jgi:hypothetical protein
MLLLQIKSFRGTSLWSGGSVYIGDKIREERLQLKYVIV